MSITDAARFAKDLATDKDLVEKVKAKASGLASLVELGKTHGYNFTLDEIKQVVSGAAKREMTDAELDAVAGGKGIPATATSTVAVTATTTTIATAVSTNGLTAVVVFGPGGPPPITAQVV